MVCSGCGDVESVWNVVVCCGLDGRPKGISISVIASNSLQ